MALTAPSASNVPSMQPTQEQESKPEEGGMSIWGDE